MISERLTNLGLRVVGMASKMFFIFYLALISPDEIVVWYGTTLVLINYAIYLVGLDIYNFTNREMILSEKPSMVYGNQFGFYAFQYFFVLSCSVLMCVYSIELCYIFFLALILISEHLFVELYRVAIFKERQVLASGVYCVKSVGLLVLSLLYYSFFGSVDVTTLSLLWLVSNSISILAFLILFKFKFEYLRGLSLNFTFIKKALVFSLPLLLSALASKAVFTFDRVLAKEYLSLSSAADYIVVMSFLFALNAALDAMYFSFEVPKLIKYFKNGELKQCTKEFCLKSVVRLFSIIPFIILSFWLMGLFLTDRFVQVDYFYLLSLILLIFIFFNLSQVFHFLIYAYGHGRYIFETQLYSFFFTIAAAVMVFSLSELNIYNLLILILIYSFFVFALKGWRIRGIHIGNECG